MTTKTANATEIRRDVWSVKHFDHSIGAWCHGFMTTDRDLAVRRHDAIRKGHWYGFSTMLAQIVHPAQWVVDGYVAAGNSVER